jgi:lactoylglutathione lyase
MSLKFTHIRLLVRDFRACFCFYRDVMGFPIAWGDEDGRYADFAAGEVVLALFDRATMAQAVGTAGKPLQAEMQDSACLIFEVEDVDVAYASLVQRGAEPAAAPVDHPDWGIRTAHLRDPDGNLIEINHGL